MHRNMRLPFAAALALAAIGLCGCFDLSQKVSIGRDGSGQYQMALTAQGIMGEALKDGDILEAGRAHVSNRTIVSGQQVTRIATVNFKSLDDLTLSDEAMSVRVVGRDWFGLGPTHAVFTRTFLVQNARRRNEQRGGNGGGSDDAGVVAGIFAGHFYTFSVTLPGSIDWIAPVKVGGKTIKPQVGGGYFAHTITWRVPLYALFTEKRLRFEAGFSAYGSFGDAQSMPLDSAS